MTTHASVAAIYEHLCKTTDNVYDLFPGDAHGIPMIYFFDQDSDSHVFVEWAEEHGWVVTWQCSPGAPTLAKLPTPDPCDPVKTAQTIAAIQSGEIDEFNGVPA